MNHQTLEFGDGRSSEEITYRTIAEQIRALTPRAIPPSSYDDVITMIDFLRDNALKLYDEVEQRKGELDKREAELSKQARELKTMHRVAHAVISTKPRRAYFWR